MEVVTHNNHTKPINSTFLTISAQAFINVGLSNAFDFQISHPFE